MLSGIPLPKVVADTGPGGNIVTSQMGANALARGNLENQFYAPEKQADISLKQQQAQYYPLQLQLQALSNPLLWMAFKDNPGSAQQMLGNVFNKYASAQNNSSNPLGNIGSSFSNSLGGKALNWILNKVTGSGDTNTQPASQNAFTSMPSMNDNSNALNNSPDTQSNAESNPAPLVPAAQGGVAGVIGAKTAPFSQQPYDQGKTAVIDNQVVSVPDAQAVHASQQAIQGIVNSDPIFKRIAAGATKFLAPGEEGKINVAQDVNYLEKKFGNLANIPEKAKNLLGITDKDISDYAAWQADQQAAVETIMKARQWPQDETSLNKISSIIQPQPGETGDGYSNRITTQLSQLENELKPSYENTLSHGFPLNQNKPSYKMEFDDSSDTNNKPSPYVYSKNAISNLAKTMDLSWVKSKEQFKKWYDAQPQLTKDAVRLKLSQEKQ